MMTGYFDESYNNRTILCGGWITTDQQWDRIIPAWKSRIAYENRVSEKHGLKPITRYHGADCASCLGEFKGWSVARQIRFVQRLQDIMIGDSGSTKVRKSQKPMVIGWGVSLDEARILIPDANKQSLRDFCYRLCVGECLKEIGRVMEKCYPKERITFFHDRGDLTNAAAAAFNDVMDRQECKGRFVTMAPMGWEDCIPLQSADMIAHDLFKLMDKRLLGAEQIRRSLRRIVGAETPIVAGCLKPGAFQQMKTWYDADVAAGKIL